MKRFEIIMPVAAVISIVSGFVLLREGKRKGRKDGSFSLMEFSFRTKTMAASSGAQLWGEGFCAFIVGGLCIVLWLLWR